MSETNNSFNTNDSETLYLDNEAYSNSVKEILLSGSELEFNPSAFDMENEINGTESLNTLISYWHSVSDTTGNYRLLLQNGVDPALNKIQSSINDTNVNVSLALALANISSVFTFSNNILNNPQGAAFTTPSGLKSMKDYIDLYIDLYNESLKLTDGNPSNDADAIARMNELLNNCIVVYDESGQKILAYDTYFIDFVIDRTPESDLIHQLFSDLKENMPSNNKIATFNESELFDYSLTISQHNAGYQLVLSANGAPHKNRINDQTVAYAATEETCDQFFYIGNDLNWDNIEKWLQDGVTRADSYEYFHFADHMIDMRNDELDKIIELGLIDFHTQDPAMYSKSDVLPLLADYFNAVVYAERSIGKRFSSITDYYSKEAKALAFSTIVGYMPDILNDKAKVTFSSIEELDGEIYTVVYNPYVDVISLTDPNITFTIYPRAFEDAMLKNVIGETKLKLSSTLSPFFTQNHDEQFHDLLVNISKWVAFKAVGEVAKRSNPILEIIPDAIDYANEKFSEYNESMVTNNIIESLDLGLAVSPMCLIGNVVTVSDGSSYSSTVPNLTFNENKLAVYVAVYNDNNSNKITVDQLKESFFENGDLYTSYNNWISANVNRQIKNTFINEVDEFLTENYEETIDSATAEQIDEAINAASGQ